MSEIPVERTRQIPAARDCLCREPGAAMVAVGSTALRPGVVAAVPAPSLLLGGAHVFMNVVESIACTKRCPCTVLLTVLLCCSAAALFCVRTVAAERPGGVYGHGYDRRGQRKEGG